MENASKALIMAASVLLGMMIIGVATYLFSTFGEYSKNVEQDRINTQMAQFNSQFTKYNGKKDITIHDIISVANLAIENNTNYGFYADSNIEKANSYFINVIISGITNGGNVTNPIKSDKFADYINKYSTYEVEDSKTKVKTLEVQYFTCTNVNINENTKRVDSITFNINS